MNPSMKNPRGLLCIWTGIDPAHELDFNRWYDREHMQERVAIPGFQSARRFAAVGPSERPYLALYYTDDLEVFTSGPYRQAFANQTAWSRENFTRMHGTQRRVGRLTVEAGDGEGGALALFVLPAQRLADAAGRERLQQALLAASTQDHVIRASLLETDAMLSTPVTADAAPAPADALVMVEASRMEVALQQAQALAASIALPPSAVHSFRSLWRLGS
jgi:type IV secretory pathway VirJ component